MKILERQIEAAVVRYAKERGVLTNKLNLMGARSMPDRIFWVPGGSPILIEFKRPGELPTPLQQHTIEQLRKRGYRVYVVDNQQQGINIISGALAPAPVPAQRR